MADTKPNAPSNRASVAELFGANVTTDPSQTIAVRPSDPGLPAGAYPRRIKFYAFDKALLKKLMFFLLTDKLPNRNLLLIGDTGCGKSSVIEQICTRINVPVFAIACSGKMRLAHFVGSFVLINGNTEWRDGPLAMAMRHNGVFLADEITRLDPSEQMALAHVLDTGAITIPETGEIVTASPGFRFVGTGNSAGQGDESGAYNGEKVASAAFLDRFQKLQIDYLPADAELAVLKAAAPRVAEGWGKAMVSFAQHVRASFVSRGGDLRTVISTRTLVAWALTAEAYETYSLAPSPLVSALNDCVLAAAPPEDAKVLQETWEHWEAG